MESWVKVEVSTPCWNVPFLKSDSTLKIRWYIADVKLRKIPEISLYSSCRYEKKSACKSPYLLIFCTCMYLHSEKNKWTNHVFIATAHFQNLSRIILSTSWWNFFNGSWQTHRTPTVAVHVQFLMFKSVNKSMKMSNMLLNVTENWIHFRLIFFQVLKRYAFESIIHPVIHSLISHPMRVLMNV